MHPSRASNCIVAVSNVAAVLPLATAFNTAQWTFVMLITLAAAVSVLQHLSDRKGRRVPVHWSVAQFSDVFLWLDRVCAVTLATYAAWTWWTIGAPRQPLLSATVGGAAAVLSEWVDLPYWAYAIIHSAWHAHAFWALYLVVDAV